MLSLKYHINEKLKIKSIHIKDYFCPKNTDELEQFIKDKKKIYGHGAMQSPIDLSYIDFSNFSNFSDISYLFDEDKDIEYLNASNWKLPDCDLECIFSSTSLKYIDVSDWDLENVDYLSGIFVDNSNLTRIDGLDTWDVSGIHTIKLLFMKCPKIKSIDLSTWNLSNCIRFRRLFKQCQSLEYIGDTSNWGLDNCTTLAGLFEGCENLKTIKGIEKWNVYKCTNFRKCFANCKNLKIDITGWKVNKNLDIDYEDMLYNCPSKAPSWYNN